LELLLGISEQVIARWKTLKKTH